MSQQFIRLSLETKRESELSCRSKNAKRIFKVPVLQKSDFWMMISYDQS